MSNRQNAEPSLRALSFALRHKEIWPDGFRWEYSSCSNCAMGLAAMMWPKKIPAYDIASMVSALGIKEHDASRIFLQASQFLRVPFGGAVMPDDIANELDKLETV